jgi:hypothetical protein
MDSAVGDVFYVNSAIMNPILRYETFIGDRLI